MSTNMTRKGLAVGVAAAFVASGLGSIPASASDQILSLAPESGSGYTVLAGSDFELNTTIPSSVPGSVYPTLSYRVQNATETSTAVDIEQGGTGDTERTFNYGLTTAADGGNIGDTEVTALTDADAVVVPNALTGEDNIAAIGGTNSLVLKPASANSAYSLDVTAWLDVNGNRAIDAGEYTSQTVTVNFVKASSVTATATMVAPLVGADTLKARVAFSDSDINVRQIDTGDVLVQFGTYASSTLTVINSYADLDTGVGETTNSTTVTATDSVKSNNSGNDVVWNAVDGVYEAVFTPVAVEVTGSTALSVEANTTYGAQIFLDQGNDGNPDGTDATDKEGDVATTATTSEAATDYSIAWGLVESADAKDTTKGMDDNGSTNATGYTDADLVAALRTSDATDGTASDATFEVFVGSDATVPAAKKSIPVTVTFTADASTLLADAVTVDGLSLYNGQTRAITKSTGTDGKVTFDIVGGKADGDDAITVDINVNGTDPAAGNEGTINFDVVDYSIFRTTSLSGNEGISIASGDTYSLSYQVVDQWGQAPANNKYRVLAIDGSSSSNERTTAADFAVSQPVVDGLATVTITDNGVGTGNYDVHAMWATVDGTGTQSGNDYVDTDVRVVADAAPATVTLDAMETDHYGSAQLNDANSDGDYTDSGDTDNRTKLVLETESIYSYITNTATATETAPTLTTGLEVTIEGTVTNAAGTAVPFAEVTLSAPKFLFVTNSNYSLNQITTVADASGDFSVNVYSNSGGINNIVVTSGSGSATQQLTYAGAASGAASDFTVTTPGASEPGRTVDVTVNVTDVNGNGVEAASVTLSSTGPGYLINTSGTTLSDGTFTTKLLLGANDSGTATIKVAMTIDSEEVIKTSTVVVGVGAVADSDKKVNAGSFKGYVAVYAKGYAGSRLSAKIGNDWVIVPSLASNFERVTDFTGAGVDIAVRIYIDRVLLDTINLTTK